jgi:hypothetical protein
LNDLFKFTGQPLFRDKPQDVITGFKPTFFEDRGNNIASGAEEVESIPNDQITALKMGTITSAAASLLKSAFFSGVIGWVLL